MSTFTITTKSGKSLENLAMNGSMFVSRTEVTADDLNADALERVTITETRDDGTTTETVLENAVCDNILHWPEGYLFNLREPSEQEKKITDLEGEVSMLTECVLEMSEIIYA